MNIRGVVNREWAEAYVRFLREDIADLNEQFERGLIPQSWRDSRHRVLREPNEGPAETDRYRGWQADLCTLTTLARVR